jgi:hypothetical protein
MAVVIAGRRFGLWRTVGDEGVSRTAGATPARHVSAVNPKLKLLKKRGCASELLVTDELRC